jgi:hypothetical protein
MEATLKKAFVRFRDTFLSQIIDRYASIDEEKVVFEAYESKREQLKQENSLLLGALEEYDEEVGFESQDDGAVLQEIYGLLNTTYQHLADLSDEEEEDFASSTLQDLFEDDIERLDELVSSLLSVY